ncbi:MAG: hypothetical protein KDC24_03880 [Saprospiraceae bacterium]|nr:hypothetical protein [Saprospiraceae bacterium]
MQGYFTIRLFLTGIICLIYSLLPAQSPELVQQARAQFDKKYNLVWTKQFKGRFNDYNDIAIALAYDGLYCKGVWQFLKSRETFRLDGTIEGKNLLLNETDEEGNITGYLQGTLDGNNFVGSWSRLDNQFGVPVSWELSERQSLLPSYCGENKWINRYTGVLGGKTLELILQKVHGDFVQGKLYLEDKNITYDVSGQAVAAGSTYLQLRNYLDEPSGYLLVDLHNQVSFKAIWEDEKKNKLEGNFDLSGRLIIGCLEYADFFGVCDIMFPKSNQSAFNKYIETFAEEFASDCRAFLRQKSKELTKDPDLRISYYANGWFETEFFNREIISGIQEFSASWEKEPVMIPVNYHLPSGKVITFEDIFREEYDMPYFVEKVVRKEMEKHPLYKSDPSFRAWIKKVDFPFFTLRREGIYFSTGFNAVYGRQGITIPFSKLRSFLKKKTYWEDSFFK